MDRSLASNNRQELTSTADLLADIAEFDARKLFRQAGYSSMFAYCVGHLRRSEVAAYKRIRVARAARRFPAIFDAIADGRLHLSGVVLLAPHLTEHSAEALMSAATNRTTREIERLLADRFPRPDLPTRVQPIAGSPPGAAAGWSIPGPLGEVPGSAVERPASAPVSVAEAGAPPTGHAEQTSRSVEEPEGRLPESGELTSRSVPDSAVAPPAQARFNLKPIAPQRFALQVTIHQETYDDLRYAQELLSHELPAGDVATVLGMALRALIPQLEKRRFAATDRPRPGRGATSTKPRHIPPDIRRAVWRRDGGRCTFVSQDGHRCEERKFVEFDHAQEVARGGVASVDGIRLRCHAHNQYTAECTFGAEFMRRKRNAAATARTDAKPRVRMKAEASSRARMAPIDRADPGTRTAPGTPTEVGTPMAPGSPTESGASIEPGTRTEPSESTESGASIEPGTRTEPSEPTESGASIEPGTRTEPSEPTESGASMEPGTRTEPSEPTESGASIERGTRTEPSESTESGASIEPGEPRSPGDVRVLPRKDQASPTELTAG